MANTQDAQNLEKIEEGIDDLLSQSKDELEKEVSLELQRKMRDSRKEISEETAENIGNKIYQNKPQEKPALTPDDRKKNIRDRSIRQTNKEDSDEEEKPDQIYQPKTKDEMEDKEEKNEKEKVADKKEGEEEKKENKDKKEESGNKKTEKEEAPKTKEEVAKKNETPEEEPRTSEGGIARADIKNASAQKTPEKEKPADNQDKQGEEEKNGKEMRKQQQEERTKKRKEKRQKTTEKALKEKQTPEKEIGKMSPLSFMFWITLAVLCDLGSLIPYIGLIFSWPFAAAFACYKWITKIKKEVAIATTALDFILEGILSTLPVNTIDVIITFVVSRNKMVRTVTKKIASAELKK